MLHVRLRRASGTALSSGVASRNDSRGCDSVKHHKRLQPPFDISAPRYKSQSQSDRMGCHRPPWSNAGSELVYTKPSSSTKVSWHSGFLQTLISQSSHRNLKPSVSGTEWNLVACLVGARKHFFPIRIHLVEYKQRAISGIAHVAGEWLDSRAKASCG